MDIADFDYDLPPELIARVPVRPRDASRMLIVERESGRLVDATFRELADLLGPSDVVVLNNTRVIPARIVGTLERSGRGVEVLFAAPMPANCWEVLIQRARRVRTGDRIWFGTGEVAGVVVGERDHGLRALRFEGQASVAALLERHGQMPLPPYLERPADEKDRDDYQTVFARTDGAVAAPTAGLHFSQEVLEALRSRGVELLEITLHVGVGTFLPVRSRRVEEHRLKPERFQVSPDVADRLRLARTAGKRVIAIGTTTARTLEFVVGRYNDFLPAEGETDLFMTPGYRFVAIDGLLTNFHLPRSTLLMLVSAFLSRELVLKAYAHAIAERYRFYSYGDCMLAL